VRKNVAYASNNKQQPEYSGKADTIITEVKEQIIENMIKEISEKKKQERLEEELFNLYTNILTQREDKDTEAEQQMRTSLIKFYKDDRRYDDMDLLSLKAMAQMLFQNETVENKEDKDLQRQHEPQPEEPQQQPQEPQQQAQRQGTNWLTLIPANELAIGVKVSINGKQEGTLDKDGLLIMNLEQGTHTIDIDAPTIEEKTIEITFANDWMMVKKEIEAQPATRKIIIITDPLMANVALNGQALKETTPIQLDIQIGQEHTITINKDGYKEKELTVKEDSKGKPKPINIQLEANQAPDTPRLIAPTGTQEDMETELKWYGTDAEGDAITYEIYLAEAGQPLEKETETKATTNAENSYTLTNLKPNTQYTWQVIAKDQWRQTQGVIWQFKTRDIISKQIRIETTPDNAAIYINGQYQGTSPLTKELPEGTHTIEARKDGYETKSQTKTIGTQTKDLSRMETITLTLERETGSLYIQSTPSGAYINIDGSYKGTTNKTIENLEPGTYSLKLRKGGYKDKTQTIQIEAGKLESAYITLESAEYQPSAQAPEQVLVKAGEFQMGNTRGDSEGDSDEKPVHTVKLTYDYYIGKYEVTFNEYDAYCEATGKSKPIDRDWGRGNRPVIYVSWNDAIKYCNWLSESEGLSKAYDSEGNLLDKNGRQTTDITQVEGYRLPTEAEWENAARGGHKSTSDYKYAGSNSIETVAWYSSNSNSKTLEVGQKAPNELGIYDMSGNVWEWCQDYWDSDYYDKSPRENPVNLNSASYRVKRSGSWGYSAKFCRVAYRRSHDPDSGYNYLGFRIARTRD